jgi:hypothetical protein
MSPADLLPTLAVVLLGTAVAVAAVFAGLEVDRRRQRAQGKVWLMAGGEYTSAVRTVAEADAPAPPEPAKSTAPLPAGRQRIAAPLTRRQFPRDAHHAGYEDVHEFAPGTKPKRDPYYGLINGAPPVALICPGCELEQAPLQGQRSCAYCGLKLRLVGNQVFWWREPVEVAEWRP